MFATLSTMFILILHTPDMDVYIGAFDTYEDCDEVSWIMSRHLSESATVECVKESDT